MRTNDQKAAANKAHKSHEAAEEGTNLAPKSEQQQYNRGNASSMTEQGDVTPPNKKEFPVIGPGKADFESRPYGRRTARMVGHEPGTERI